MAAARAQDAFVDRGLGASTQRNPILETQVFSKAKSSKSVIEASPSQVHIAGFKPGVVSKATIKLINRGSKPIRTQIVNPTSPFFKLTYTRKSKLVPGSAEILTLEFQCSEPRYYYDCIRVQVQDSANVLIPLHAYPVPAKLSLPAVLDFGICALGDIKTKNVTVSHDVPIDVDFTIGYPQPNAALTVAPLSGTLRANTPLELSVTYAPQRYTTDSMEFSFTLGHENAVPSCCRVSGRCQQGLTYAADTQRQAKSAPDAKTRAPVPPAEAMTSSRRRRSAKETRQAARATPEGPDLNTVSGVNSILNQRIVHRHADHAESSLTSNSDASEQEARFRAKVAPYRQATLSLGQDALSDEQRRCILAQRRADEQEYEYLCRKGPRVAKEALARTTTETEPSPLRTFRWLNDDTVSEAPVITFKEDASENIIRKAAAHQRFVSAARTVLIRLRADRRLCYFRKHGGRPPQPDRPPSPRATQYAVDATLPRQALLLPVRPLQQSSSGQDSTSSSFLPLQLPSPPVPSLELEMPESFKLMNYSTLSPREAQDFLPAAPLAAAVFIDVRLASEEEDMLGELKTTPY